MKLYYKAGACSLASHIVAQEAGLPIELEAVDLATKKTSTGADYTRVTEKGYVPALQLEDGSVLTEGTAVVQYLADQRPASMLAPANGTVERYQLQALLGYINSELHKSCGPLFNPATLPEVRAERLAYLTKRYGYIERLLQDRKYLTGEHFTVADAYLFTVTSWADRIKLDLKDFPNLRAFQQRVAQRPAVIAAMRAEGLLK